MVSQAVKDDLNDRISNFSLEDEYDRQHYERINALTGSTSFIEDLKRIEATAHTRYDLSRLPRAKLEQQLRETGTRLTETIIAMVEFKTLLTCLDLKISKVIRALDEDFQNGLFQPENLMHEFAMYGFTPRHKLFRRSSEKQAQQTGGRHLRLVKK